MFRKPFSFRRKGSDEGRQPRFQRTSSQSSSPNLSPSGLSIPIQEDHVGSTTSLPQLSQITTYSHPRKNSETDPGPLGLNVIYTPENGHKADIVFIHGLGGTSRLTWSKYKNPELYWPLTFLPLEPDVCLARILTFGFNANFRRAGNVSTSVLDFAKDLLFDLKYAKDEQKEDLNMGNAYVQGQNDPEYESIIKAISAITFLATPHRGTNLAEILNRILQSTILTNSKQYISELAKNSLTLQKLNEQFRHIAPRLDIVSFYETQPTSIGLKNARIMVVEKDSSVLGYPGETSKALSADHHGVCKYDSPRDPNYITVRNVLKSLVSKIILTSKSNKPPLSNRRESHDLRSLLAITELPGVDYIFFRDQWTQGTSDWILGEKSYLEWLHARESTPHLLWLNGGAATGKSVLSSFIINSLVEQGVYCQYFFIRFGDQKKRTLSLLLRSIAYQVAQSVPGFLQRVVELVDEAIDFETADPRTIWQRIFKSILFNLKERQPLHWIIDGLDEADNPQAVIRLLSDVSLSSIPIRILLVGRKTSEIVAAFQKVPKVLKLELISIEGHLEDLRCYIRQELSMSGSAEFKEIIIQRIIEGAQNNFLWVRLAVDKLNLCHTHADVELALQQLPVGMEALYNRMASSIAQNTSSTDRALVSAILQCVTCSLHVLTVAELSQALDEDTSQMLDFQRSIVDLCGGFVVIDNGGNVAMIHQTAREYLLHGNNRPFHIDYDAAHKQMFLSCMRCLMAIGLRAKVNRNQKPEFLDYAASWWSSHLTSTPFDCGQVAEALNKFLTGHWVLTWIQVLATSKQLRVLIQASKDLSRYSAKQKEHNAARNKRDHHIMEQELIDSWAVDFMQIVGKFGTNLRRNPESIYKLIPPFCPQNSSIYQLFGKTEAKSLVVSGVSTENWDDSPIRISLGFGTYASFISAAGAQIAILASSGSVFIYDSSIFEEAAASPIKHGERVYRMALNSTGTLLATYGYRTTIIWEISTGKRKMSVENIESRPRPLAMLLTNNSTTLLVGTEDRRIRSLNLNQSPPAWQLVAELEEPELDGHFLNSSSYMALNNDGSLIAVAYRGHPLSAWETDGPVHIGHCWRKREEVARGEVIEAVWHPYSPEVLGLYIEGVVFKWRPYDGELDEITTGASRLAISGDGNLFATGDVHGVVKVYTTSDFCLLYQLASQDTVLGLAFSPDLCRFYDIRGYYGNAWEPNALMRFAEQTGKGIKSGSETESLAQSSTTSISWSQRIDSTTVLAGSPIGRLYCCGTEKGTVRLHDTQRGKLADLHMSKSFLSIEQMSWSKDGRYVCFSDSSKKVFIMSITPSAGNSDPVVTTKAEIPMKNSMKGPILQLLFQTDSSHLLVYTSSSIRIISLTSSSVTYSLELYTAECKWIPHPHDPALVIGVGPNAIHILDWNLAERQTYKIEYSLQLNMPSNLESSSDQDTVDRVLVTHDKKHVLVQMSLLNQKSKEKTFLYFETSSFSTSTATTPGIDQKRDPITITPVILPRNLSSQIALSLSFLSHDRLIFLSRTFSICSWQLPSGFGPSLSSSRSITRSNSMATTTTNSTTSLNHHHNNDTNLHKQLFSLPGDWISRDCLALCSIWGIERSLLCPRNGEVAIVRCAALV
ncbi:MAG: hypothetical protein Q9187_003286 [Circinaria calcarea]